MPTPGFDGLPEVPDLREIARVVNRMLIGGLNIGGSITLAAGDSTTVSDSRVSGGSIIQLQATNDEAALLQRTASVYVADANRADGSFVITHVGATGLESFNYIAIK